MCELRLLFVACAVRATVRCVVCAPVSVDLATQCAEWVLRSYSEITVDPLLPSLDLLSYLFVCCGSKI